MTPDPTKPAKAAKPKAEPAQSTRRGPRGGSEDVKAQILNAARELFARDGYQATTIKAIAASAEVDTKLVHYYFGTKGELFATLITQVFSDFGLLQELIVAAQTKQPGGETYLKNVLTLLETSPEGEVFIGLIRSVGNHAESQQIMMTFVSEVLARISDVPNGEALRYRASLLGTQVVGLVFVRYILKNPVIVEASIDQLARSIGPTLDRYLSGDIAIITTPGE